MQDSQKPVSSENIQITNEVSGYKLELLDKENLLAFLSETGFFKKGVYSSIEDETVVQPANLEIVFASAPQNLAKLYMVGESVPFQSYGYKYDISNNTLRVFLYYSTKVREEVSAEKPHYEQRVTYDVLKLICGGTVYGDINLGEQICNDISHTYTVDKKPIFKLVRGNNLQSLLHKFSIIKTVFASCSGLYDCGNWQYSCSDVGFTCNDTTQPCGPLNNGTCTRTCDGSQGQIACGWTNQTDCEASHCSAFNCSTGNCSWTPDPTSPPVGPTPTPTTPVGPTPTPTTPGGPTPTPTTPGGPTPTNGPTPTPGCPADKPDCAPLGTCSSGETGNCSAGYECCPSAPTIDCDTQGGICVPASEIYDGGLGCTIENVGKYAEITNTECGGSAATCNDSCDEGGSSANSGAGKLCGTTLCSTWENMCLINLNPYNRTNRQNPDRYDANLYNLPSKCGYITNQTDRNECAAHTCWDNQKTYMRLGPSSNLAKPNGNYCVENCNTTSCLSDGATNNDQNGIGANNISGWKSKPLIKWLTFSIWHFFLH